MKHSLITSIIGLAMVANVSTVAVAEDNFSILEGIQAEAMSDGEMEEVQGKMIGFSLWPNFQAIQYGFLAPPTPFSMGLQQNLSAGGTLPSGLAQTLPLTAKLFDNLAQTNPINNLGVAANAISQGFNAAFYNAPFLNPFQPPAINQQPVRNGFTNSLDNILFGGGTIFGNNIPPAFQSLQPKPVQRPVPQPVQSYSGYYPNRGFVAPSPFISGPNPFNGPYANYRPPFG